MAKVKVCSFSEVPEGGIKSVKAEELPIALYKISGNIFATTNICTHEQCFLDENHFLHNDVIECTCHGSQFDIKSGEVVLPPAVEKLKTYKTEVIADEVYVEV